MDRIENLERYLRAQIAVEHSGIKASDEQDVHPFVTISRQSGTGAHSIAESILETFERQADRQTFDGWRIYDRTLCEIVAKDPRFTASLDSLLEEEYRSKTNDFFHQMLRATPDQTMLMDRVVLVVRTVAGMGKAIIVGRGGAHITQGMAGRVSLRLIAPEEQRILRTMEAHDITHRAARSEIRGRDADRERMMRTHCGVDISDPSGYDITMNTGQMTHADIAQAVTALVRSRADEV